MELYSIYIHIPFCKHRCAYCDFNTYAGQESMIPAYIDALCHEARLVASAAPTRLPVHTLFFGGGTPSLLPSVELEKLMAVLRSCFDFQKEMEISLEANPGTVSPEYLSDLNRLGFNRLSFGVQSAHPDDLRLLERQHDFLDVIQAVEWARKAGFRNLNLDLIFGVPFQTLARWQSTVELVLGLKPEHLSLYALTVEHGTPFQHWTSRGLVPLPDDDLAADMYEWASERLAQAGFEQYEISNWASKDGMGRLLACRHNLQYWYNQPYLGLGAGAHGYTSGYRTANVLAIPAYIQRCQTQETREFPLGPALANALPIDEKTAMQETMMVGLRLTQEGVPDRVFENRFGKSIQAVFPEPVERLCRQGLLEWTEDKRLRLTTRGRLLGNRVFREFVGD
jgi:oxygen-independent coproporphyrinogen-3 oxidase